jgi:hypothetical protein
MPFTLATVLLTLAVLGGGTLFTLRLVRGVNPPLILAFVHGAFAAGGVVALLVAVIATGNRGAPLIALCLFGVTAPLGAWFLSRHLRGKLIPVPGVMMHGMVALFGYAILLTEIF